jgi:AraC-like DNA-binding protein
MSAMWRTYQITRGSLAGYVNFLWLSESYSQPHQLELILPTATVDMVVDLAQVESPRSVVSGVQSRAVELDTAGRLSLIGARFKPGGASALLGIPAAELYNRTVSLETVWGHRGGELREKLHLANLPLRRFQILEDFLADRLRGKSPPSDVVRRSVTAIHAAGETVSVQGLALGGGMSAVRFSTLFNGQVGLTPKSYAKIVRFQRAIAAIGRTADVDWASIALGCGYFDQAHFNHDFREFCGMAPSKYLTHRTGHPNHVVKTD